MTPTLILVPSRGGGDPDHWLPRWAEKFGAVRVPQPDGETPEPAAQVARLQEAISATPGDLVLIGYGGGALTIVRWARLAHGHERVRGALLVAPGEGVPTFAAGSEMTTPVAEQELPFPALVVASETDPHLPFERAQALAEAWGAEFVSAGEAGHVDAASGYGDWPDGEVLLGEALHAWTPPDFVRL